jgi:hypothetical protein
MMAVLFGGGNAAPSLGISDPSRVATIWEMPSCRDGGPSLAAYSAVGAQPERRPANTAETYELFLASTTVERGQTALLVTSAIYAPYQHLDAVRVLGQAGLEIETVGSAVPRPRSTQLWRTVKKSVAPLDPQSIYSAELSRLSGSSFET